MINDSFFPSVPVALTYERESDYQLSKEWLARWKRADSERRVSLIGELVPVLWRNLYHHAIDKSLLAYASYLVTRALYDLSASNYPFIFEKWGIWVQEAQAVAIGTTLYVKYIPSWAPGASLYGTESPGVLPLGLCLNRGLMEANLYWNTHSNEVECITIQPPNQKYCGQQVPHHLAQEAISRATMFGLIISGVKNVDRT